MPVPHAHQLTIDFSLFENPPGSFPLTGAYDYYISSVPTFVPGTRLGRIEADGMANIEVPAEPTTFPVELIFNLRAADPHGPIAAAGIGFDPVQPFWTSPARLPLAPHHPGDPRFPHGWRLRNHNTQLIVTYAPPSIIPGPLILNSASYGLQIIVNGIPSLIDPMIRNGPC
jgi:hypothetical protein